MADVLAGLAGRLAVLSGEEPVPVALFAEVLEGLAGAVRGVVEPSLLRGPVVVLAII